MNDDKPLPDLYEALGIERGIDTSEIKRAFRKRARETHPDTGAVKDGFWLVELAHRTLMDPEKRKRYDETGRVDEVDNSDLKAREQAMELLLQVIEQSQDIDHVDICSIAVKHAEKLIKEVHDKLKIKKAALDRFDAALRKLKRKNGGSSPVVTMARTRVAQFKTRYSMDVEELKKWERVAQIFREHEFEFTSPEPMVIVFSTNSSAGSTGP